MSPTCSSLYSTFESGTFSVAICNTNLSAEFPIASKIIRIGNTSAVTPGHTKEIDLLVRNSKGKMITINVKGLKNITNWPVKPKLISDTHFFVLATQKNRFSEPSFLPEVFVIPSKQVVSLLSKWCGNPNVTAIGYDKVKNSRSTKARLLLEKQKILPGPTSDSMQLGQPLRDAVERAAMI